MSADFYICSLQTELDNRGQLALKMIKSCCVPFCRSRKTRDSKFTFHSFPPSETLRKQWLQAVQRNIRKSPRNSNPFVISEHTKVCSKHFLKTDYWCAGNALKLRKNAVPIIFNLPKEKDNAKALSSTKERTEQNQDISKENKLSAKDNILKKNVKRFNAKIGPKRLRKMGFQKNKQKSIKDIKNVKNPEMIQNCRNLLLINNDHSYAALWQNELVESKKDSSSEDDTDNDEAEVPSISDAVENVTKSSLDTQKKLAEVEEIVNAETENTSLKENIIAISNKSEIHNKTDLGNVDVRNTIESIYLKEEVIETLSEESNVCTNTNITQDTSSENDAVVCIQPIENKSIYTSSTAQNKNIENDKVSHTKPKRINVLSKRNLPEICILCATANMTRKNYTLIVHFAEMIMDLSGVDILKSNISPIACNVCFKNVLEMWNFKQQIISADKFIREKIPKQPQTPINLIPKPGSGNIPKPSAATFEYIDCNKQKLNNTVIDVDGHEQIDDLAEQAVARKTNKSLSTVEDNKNEALLKSKINSQKKDNGITFVPIENILKENDTGAADYAGYDDIDSESSEDSSNLPTCTICGNTFTNNNTKTCRCEETVKKKNVQSEKFVCSICGKQYPLLRSLKRHEITHKAKKYLCSVCGEVFHFRLYLKRHMRKHSGKKPFPCPYCNKRFSTQWNLSQHKRLHTNSLPYECRLCPTAFRHNVTLKKHIRLFHTADEFIRNCQNSNSPVNSNDAKN